MSEAAQNNLMYVDLPLSSRSVLVVDLHGGLSQRNDLGRCHRRTPGS